MSHLENDSDDDQTPVDPRHPNRPVITMEEFAPFEAEIDQNLDERMEHLAAHPDEYRPERFVGEARERISQLTDQLIEREERRSESE